MNHYNELELTVINCNLERMRTVFKRILSPSQVAHLIPEEQIEAVFKRLIANDDAKSVSAGTIWDGIVFFHQHCVLDTHAQSKILDYVAQKGHSRIYARELTDIGDEKVVHHTLENMLEQELIYDLDRARYGRIDSFVAR